MKLGYGYGDLTAGMLTIAGLGKSFGVIGQGNNNLVSGTTGNEGAAIWGYTMSA